MSIELPDLNQYKSSFAARGIKLPLDVVKIPVEGMLAQLPAPPIEKTGWPWTEETPESAYDKNIIWPKITIVTPSYNQGSFIEETIRAVLLQNYPNLEYIIMDGGSTDETRTILKKYSPWISYYQHEPDRGQGHAINMGFSIASGDYYAWINSDDYYTRDAFLTVMSTFVKTHVDFIYGYSYNFDTTTSVFGLVKTTPLLDYFIRIPTLAQPACFWNAKIHQPIWESLHCSLDYELWVRMVKGQTRKLLKEPLAVANIHAAAKTHTSLTGQHWANDHALICSEEAHGAVYNWNRMVFINRIYKFIGRLTHLY